MANISVIIPAYNAAKYINKTIQSVLEQTYLDWELIIINDGSTDATLEQISQISDPRLKVFNFPNAGVAISRNRGMNQASGEYIAFLDADDLWTPDKLASQLSALKANPQAAVAYSWVDYIDESEKFLYPGIHTRINGDAYEQLLVRNILENGSNPLIKKSACIAIGNFEQSLTPAEDWDFYLRLAKNYAFVTVPLPQILYRISTNSGSTNVEKMEQKILQVLDKAYNQAPESLQPLRKKAKARLYEYLVFKNLAINIYPQGYLKTWSYWLKLISYEPSILKTRSRLMLIVLFKLLLGIVLPIKLR